jgi:acyl carrier protein
MSNKKQLFRVFSDVLKVDVKSLDESSSPDTIPNWDSLAVINLVGELEQTFKVQFDILEIADFQNIGIIKSILEEKGVFFDDI